MAINDVKLFDAEFQAWVHCPTCVKLKNNTILDDSYVVLGIKNADEIVDENIISFLQQVISTYGEYNKYDLESIVQQCYAYNKARENCESYNACYVNIEDEDIIIEYRFPILKNFILGNYSIEELSEEIKKYFSENEKKC